MRIELRLLLSFKDKAPDGKNPVELELSAGATVAGVLEFLSISASTDKVVLLNGRVTAGEQKLKDGDQLTVFPPLEGG